MIKKKNIIFLSIIIFTSCKGLKEAQSNMDKPTPKQTECENLQIGKAEQKFQDYLYDQNKQNCKLKDCKDSLDYYHKDVCKEYIYTITLHQEQLAACQDELSAFRFFSNTEATIFSDSTLEHSGWNKKLTGTYLAQYEVISHIREADQAISDVEKTIEKTKSQQKDKNWTEDQLKTAIILEIENAINKITPQLNEIDEMKLFFLSEKQKDYYLSLKGRYFDIYRYIHQ